MTSCTVPGYLTGENNRQKQKERNPVFLDDIAFSGSSKTGRIERRADRTASGIRDIERKQADITALQEKYAGLMKVVPYAIGNSHLYQFIDEWYGVRYRMGGNDKSGIDCSAFVQKLYEQVFHTYIMRSAFEQFTMCAAVCSADSLQEGDLVFFNTAGRRISHVGIYLTNSFFVHASTSQGVTISSLKDAYWKRFYAGAGKILDVATETR